MEVWWAEGVGCAPAACPLCSELAPAGCSLAEWLRHLLGTCSAVAELRAACPHADAVNWALSDTTELDILATRVRVVGLASRAWACCARASAARTTAAAVPAA